MDQQWKNRWNTQTKERYIGFVRLVSWLPKRKWANERKNDSYEKRHDVLRILMGKRKIWVDYENGCDAYRIGHTILCKWIVAYVTSAFVMVDRKWDFRIIIWFAWKQYRGALQTYRERERANVDGKLELTLEIRRVKMLQICIKYSQQHTTGTFSQARQPIRYALIEQALIFLMTMLFPTV